MQSKILLLQVSVCLSVTFRFRVKMAKCVIESLSSHGVVTVSVFLEVSGPLHVDGVLMYLC